MKPPILPGNRYSRLVVQHESPRKPGDKHRQWSCLCDCGTLTDVRSSKLLPSGDGQGSCGCARASRELRQAAAAKIPQARRKEISAAGGYAKAKRSAASQ
jgi:hypothetical protein